MKKGVVIGAGLSGLIAGYYSGYEVLGIPDGGQNGVSKYKLGPRILEADDFSEEFIRSLYGNNNMPKKEQFEIYYVENEKVYKPWELSNNNAKELRKIYYFKTRGCEVISKSSMSEGKHIIIGWDIDKINLYKVLRAHVNVTPLRVESITQGCKVETKLGHISMFNVVDEIITTINLRDFLRIYSGEIVGDGLLRALDTHFTICKKDTELLKGLDRLRPGDYAYVPELHIPFHRISMAENYMVLESKEQLPLEWRKKLEVLENIIIGDCQITTNYGIKEYKNIKFVGRYSEWNHATKLNTTIRRMAIEYA